MINDFNYWLIGTGWAEVFFSNNKQNFKFELSYLSNPLLELFAALIKMLKGESDQEEIAFWDEPGLHLLTISKENEEKIYVQILQSDCWGEMDNAKVPLSEKLVVFSDTDTLANFASVICAGIDSLLERHTLIEYKEMWYESPFPVESYAQLKQALQKE